MQRHTSSCILASALLAPQTFATPDPSPSATPPDLAPAHQTALHGAPSPDRATIERRIRDFFACDSLKIVYEVRHGDHKRLHGEAWMTHDAFLTTVAGEPLPSPVRIVRHGTVVVETTRRASLPNALTPLNDIRVQYEAPSPAVAIDASLLLGQETGCEVGTLLGTWLGERGVFSPTQHSTFVLGTMAFEPLDGRTVVRFERTVDAGVTEDGAPLSIAQWMWFDEQTGCLLRWDTEQKQGDTSILRQRSYVITRNPADLPADLAIVPASEGW